MRKGFEGEEDAARQAMVAEVKMMPAAPVRRNLHVETRAILIELPTAEMSLTNRPTLRMGLGNAARLEAESRLPRSVQPAVSAPPSGALESPLGPESGILKVAEAHARLAKDLAPGDYIGDRRYRLLEPLSHGNMAHVFKAVQLNTGQTIAIKVLLHAGDSRARKNAKRELEALVRAAHPNVVNVLDADLSADSSSGNIMWIATEFVAGETLRKRLVRGGRLPLGEALDIMVDVFDGLAAAHEAKVLHLDLKPENILRGRGFTKICDLGTAALLDSGHHTTDRGGTIATPEYIAPERLVVANGRPMKSDFRCDLYSAGLCLYEIIAGFHPLIPEGFPEGRRLAKETVCLRQLEFSPNVLTSIPTALWELIEELIRKDPERRPQSARAVAQRLREIRASLHVMPADLEPPTPQAPVWANRIRSLLVGAAAGVVGFVVLAALAYLAGAPLSRGTGSRPRAVEAQPHLTAALTLPRAEPKASAAPAPPHPGPTAVVAQTVPTPGEASLVAPSRAVPKHATSVRPARPRGLDLRDIASGLPSLPSSTAKLPRPRPKEISDTPPF